MFDHVCFITTLSVDNSDHLDLVNHGQLYLHMVGQGRPWSTKESRIDHWCPWLTIVDYIQSQLIMIDQW